METNAEILERITGKITGVVVDTTLTKKGMAAEAKATGEALANLQAQIDELKAKE